MTTRQKQHLLGYLGYYTGNVDGDWGALSRQGAAAFQRDYGLTEDGIWGDETEKRVLEVIYNGEQPPKIIETDTDSWWGDIQYFDRWEFACKCGKCGGFPAEPKETLVRTADRVRGHFGAAAIVSSGIRCTKHNAKVGGVSNSRHLSGKAMDFCVSGFSATAVLSFVRKQPEIRYAYAIDSNFVHMDVE